MSKAKEHIKKMTAAKSHLLNGGCVTKHVTDFRRGNPCSYRGTGYVACSSSDKIGIYNINFTLPSNAARLPKELKAFKHRKVGFGKGEPDSERTADNPAKIPGAWWFGRGRNFEVGFEPYNHNYHHIFPGEALKSFPEDELLLLQQVGYNLNAGINMIILPMEVPFGMAMLLPCHPNYHRQYNMDIKRIVAEIRQEIAESEELHGKGEDARMMSIKDKIEKWSEREFQSLNWLGYAACLDNRGNFNLASVDVDTALITKDRETLIRERNG